MDYLSSSKNGQPIGEFVVLSGYPEQNRAMKMLREVASLVKPIIQKHGWYIPILTEFWKGFGSDGEILLGYNTNRGTQIALRLRRPEDKFSFLPLDEVVGTMLHELTHNVFGPHDEKFYNLLDQLKWEYHYLRKSGYNGEGFYYENGQSLGRGQSYYPELTKIRRQALTGENRLHSPQRQTAQPSKPAAVPAKAPKAPNKTAKAPGLGGKPVSKNDRVRIAEAAERRRREAQRCGVQHHGDRQMEDMIQKGIQSGIHEKADPLTEDEMAAIMIQIKFLEEAEREARRENGGETPVYIAISDDEDGEDEKADPDEMAAIMVQIQALEEAEREARRENGGKTPVHIAISDDEDEKADPDEMAAIMIQIQFLEEAEREAPRGNGGETPVYIAISDNEKYPVPVHGRSNPAPSFPSSTQTPGPSSGGGRTNHANSRLPGGASAEWSCSGCTLLNPVSVTRCELCETVRA